MLFDGGNMASYLLHLVFKIMSVIAVSTVKNGLTNCFKLHKFNRFLLNPAQSKRGFGFNKVTGVRRSGNAFPDFQVARQHGLPIKQPSFNLGENAGLGALSAGNEPAIPSEESNWMPHSPASSPLVGPAGQGGNGLGALGKGQFMPGHTNEENADDESIDQLLKSFQQEDAAGNIYHHWDHDNVFRKPQPMMFQQK